MKKISRLIVILLVLTITICLTYCYIQMESNNNKIGDTYIFVNEKNEVNDVEEEINLGDTSNCTNYGYRCLSGGYESGGYCYSNPGFLNYNDCANAHGYYVSGTCYFSRTTAQKVCTKCNDYYYLNSSNKCQKCVVQTVSSSKKRVSPGTLWCAGDKISYNNKQCEKYPISFVGGSSCKLAQESEVCGLSTIKAQYGTQSITISVTVAGEWKEEPDGLYENNMVKTEREADAFIYSKNEDPKMEYGQCTEQIEGDKTYYYCTGVHKRGRCGSKSVKSYSYCCVNNQYVGVSDSVIWAEHKAKNNTSTFDACKYYYGNDYTYVNVSKDKCKVTSSIPGRCIKAPNSNNVDTVTENCEENNEIKIYDGEKCTGTDINTDGENINTSFYSVSCSKTINANFDYGDDSNDNTIRELYRGQGFKFGINVSTKVNCDGEFNGTRWKNVYDKLFEKIRNVESGLVNACKDFSASGLTKCEQYINKMKFNREKTKSDVFELLTIIRDLVNMVDNYNKYEPNLDYNEEAKIDFTYKTNGGKSTKSVNDIFNKNVVNAGVYKSINETTVNLGVPGITNPKNYSRNNYDNPRVVKFTLKNVYIDKSDGVIKENPTSKVDGGAKLYIDYNADVQSISPINIVVSSLAGTTSSISDNKCSIDIKDLDIIYRPIDVSNPFINNQWTPGSNWVNSQFDFRNIIHDDVWTGDNCYSKYVNGAWTKCN